MMNAAAPITDLKDMVPVGPDSPAWLGVAALRFIHESVLVTTTDLEEPGPAIVYVNPAFTKMTGYTAEEVIGRNPRFLQGPKTRRSTLDRLRARLAAGETFEGEDVNYKKDGTEFFIDWYIEPLRDAQGRLTHFLAVQRDVTERRMLEAQIQQAQRLEGIGLLASGIAHDLNNVLAPILMGSGLLRDSSVDPSFVEIVNLMEASAERGSNLVKQILSFARGISGEGAVVQPRHVLNDLVKITRQTFPKTISISADVPQDCWTVAVDPIQLHQILLNLFVNARDAIDEVGTISAVAENIDIRQPVGTLRGTLNPGKYVRVSVEDSGSGIPPEIVDRIFDPFFTSKEVGKGTGLGLATVSTILKNIDGGLDLRTGPAGTTFSVYVPASRAEGPVLVPWNVAKAARGDGCKLLIVEDEAALAEIIKESSLALGYEIEVAVDGVECFTKYGEHHFDCVILDLLMPARGGGELMPLLKSRWPGAPIIVLTGLSAEQANTLAPDAERVLTKPCSAETLFSAITDVLGAKKRSAPAGFYSI